MTCVRSASALEMPEGSLSSVGAGRVFSRVSGGVVALSSSMGAVVDCCCLWLALVLAVVPLVLSVVDIQTARRECWKLEKIFNAVQASRRWISSMFQRLFLFRLHEYRYYSVTQG